MVSILINHKKFKPLWLSDLRTAGLIDIITITSTDTTAYCSATMRAESRPDTPNSHDTANQKQDPLERRRLQNRLSQRNHRKPLPTKFRSRGDAKEKLIGAGRKIRDRIAKLQERVIANELRATAALKGWDQTCAPPPLLNTRHGLPAEVNIDIASRDSSSMTTESSISLTQPQQCSPSLPWSNEMTACLTPGILSADLPYFGDGEYTNDPMCSPSSLANLMSDIGLPSSPLNNHGCNHGGSREFLLAEGSPGSDHSNTPTSTNQPLYYTATGKFLSRSFRTLKRQSRLTRRMP